MILFEPATISFNNNGLGHIKPIKCVETKKKSLNGWFIECELPIKYKDVVFQDYILFVETKEKGGQPFRINNIQKTDRKITITANHVIFDTERYMLIDVRPTELSPVSFLDWINKRTETASPFETTSNVSGSGTKYFIRKTLLKAFVETEELFGGNYDIDKFKISLKNRIGNDDGFSLVYGKNIQSASVIEDWSSVCTRIIPVGPDELMLPNKFIDSETQYDTPFTRTIPFDFETEEMSEADKTRELERLSIEYLLANSKPRINYIIKSDVDQTLGIGDIIRVKHPLVLIDTEVQSYTYDTIKKRVLTLEFGNYTRDVKKAFDSIKESIKKAEESASGAYSEARKQTEIIKNLNKKGLVYIDENEILILDKLPKESANQVWRFGLGGLGFSNNGYEGPFEYALTQDGHFNVDFIQANSITVNKLTADIGSSIDISSNESVSVIINDITRLDLTIDGLSNIITSTGGNNLISNSMGVYEDGWSGKWFIDKSVEIKKRNIYGFAISLANDTLKQSIQLPNGNYTLSFSYVKYINLASIKLLINGEEFVLSNNELTNFKYTFEVTSGNVEIQFISDTDFACSIVNMMLNQGSDAMIWSLNSNETWSDTMKMSSSGLTIESSGADVLFNAKADIIGFKNKNTGEYVAIFTDVGATMKELVVKNKAKIVGLLVQEINRQTVINRIVGDD